MFAICLICLFITVRPFVILIAVSLSEGLDNTIILYEVPLLGNLICPLYLPLEILDFNTVSAVEVDVKAFVLKL